MPTPILMPQMGESIAEGTIVRWLKKVGDSVDRDEPLFEITTDKVEADIPSPTAGVLTEITAAEGQTVAVNTIVGMIQPAGEAPTPVASPSPIAAGPADASRRPIPAPVTPAAAGAAAPVRSTPAPGDRRQRSSPLVRRIAREHSVDLGRIDGSGVGGRVTKQDILEHLSRGSGLGARELGEHRAVEGADVQPLSPMRKKIAEHMVLSRRTAAHVHSVFHVDFSTIAAIRQEKKAEYERLGTKLTYMAFIARAVIEALQQHPIVNASLDGENVVYQKRVNLGIAVALEGGLIVPVIRNADEKNVLGLSRAIADLAERARARQLKPEDVHGGTFTITNPGQSGAQFGMPIINQPQSAILGVGTIERRPVVIGDGIAIRTMSYLTLGYDHRLIDGAAADQFMADVKRHIEQFDSQQL